MSSPQHSSFTVYAAAAEIPRYQRAWVWGVAALGILLCGIATGWLLNGSTSAKGLAGTEGAALLTRQEAVNQQLRDRITRLEQALSRDPCSQEALDALRQNPPPQQLH